jgi:branched-chain amino acid transport system substrate-binding protein
VNALVKEIATRTHQKVLSGSTAVSGYSVVQAFKIAAERAHSLDQTPVMKQLQKFRNVPLITGLTTFTKTVRQSLGRPMRVIKVQNGKFHFLKVFTPHGVHL